MIIDFIKSIGIFICAIAALLGLIAGIIKSIEYIEDKAYSAKNKIKKIVIVSMILHLWLLLRGRSMLQTLFSLTIQYSFYCMLEIYPIVKLDNPFFIYGTVASLVNHFLVIRLLFYRNLYSLEILLIFGLIWVTPFCFFMSLSANDEVIVVKGKTTTNTLIGNFLKNMLNKNVR